MAPTRTAAHCGFGYVESPKHGTISGSGSQLTYSPRANVHGSDSFNYTVTDNRGAVSKAATVSIEIESVNDQPVAIAQTVTLKEDESVAFELSGSDVDGQIVSRDIVAFPQHGTITQSGTVRTYQPHADFQGTDSLQFAVTDDLGLVSKPATVNIAVIPQNDQPTVEAIDPVHRRGQPGPRNPTGRQRLGRTNRSL